MATLHSDAIKDNIIITPSNSVGKTLVGEVSPTLSAGTSALSPNNDTFGTKSKLPTTQSMGQSVYNTAQDVLFDINGWNENILSSLQQPSYKIRFFMAEDDPLNVSAAASYDDFASSINSRQQTTIAATGVTALNILSLTMTTVAAPNKATRSMAATEFTMVIKEPMGSSLMDVLAQSARELRVRNFSKAFYFIEISFHGYNSDGSFNHNPFTENDKAFANKGIWLYQVGIKQIATEMDNTGGKYTLQLIPYEEKMYEEDDLRLPEAIMVSGNQVDKLLDDLAIQLNKSIETMYGFQARKYKFKFYNVQLKDKPALGPSNFTVIPSDEKFAHKSAYSMNPSDGTNGMIKAHFNRNMTINDVVELVFANSTAAKELGLGDGGVTTSDAYAGAVKADKKSSMRECLIYRVEVTSDIMSGADGYDYSNENYAMEYTLHVLPYLTQTPILAYNDVTVSNDPKVQVQNALNLRKNNYLSKRYDYLFTGMNTEVLHLDVKFNLNWQAALPRLLGTGTSMESVAQGDKKNTDIMEIQKKQQALLTEANNITRKRTEKQQELSATHDALIQLKKTGKNEGENKESYDAMLKKYNENASAYTNDTTGADAHMTALVTQRDLKASISATHRIIQDNNIKKRAVRDSSRDLNRFGEDILSDPQTSLNRIPISFVQSSADTRFITSGAMNDTAENTRSIYGSVLNQLYGTMTDGLQKITMDIKGDPYWLGSGNMERTYKLNSLKPYSTIRLSEPDEYDINRPDYTRGDILCLVSFKYPQGYDGETGAPVFKINDFFTGVYQVRKITHKFDGGEYKQTLEANRMPLIDVFKAFGYHDTVQEKADADAVLAKEKNKYADDLIKSKTASAASLADANIAAAIASAKSNVSADAAK